MKVVIFVIVLTSMSYGQSHYRNHYDYKTGNNTRTYDTGYSTVTKGFNSRTGSNWRVEQRKDGSYSGRDSKGNYFKGNHKTGTYNNFGTGKSCYGKGAYRVCN